MQEEQLQGNPEIRTMKRKQRCCWFISLKIGVCLLALSDFIAFGLLIYVTLYTFTLEREDQRAILLFSLITDGIITFLFLIKCYYGSKFLIQVILPPKTQKKNLQGNDLIKENKICGVKVTRKSLNSYFLSSTVAYFFTIIQQSLLLFVFFQYTLYIEKILCYLCYCILSILYSQRKVLQLLTLKDSELMMRTKEARNSAQNSFIEESETVYLPPTNQNELGNQDQTIKTTRSSYQKANQIY